MISNNNPSGLNRRTMVFAVNDAEKSFKQTVEVDRLIDVLRDSNEKEVSGESRLNCLEHSSF